MNHSSRRATRGSALITTLVLLTALSVLTAAFASLGLRWTKQHTAAMDDSRAFVLAEAGASEAAMSLFLGTDGNLASRDMPIRHGQGLFWVEAEDIGPLRVRLRSTALVNRSRATVEMVVQKEYDSIARYALFSDEPLRLGSNTMVDSFDPVNGPYDSQPQIKPDGSSQPMVDPWTILMSNSDILPESNVAIGGDSVAGPGYDTLSKSNFYVSGSTEPAKEEVAEEIPPTPSIFSSGPYVAGSTTGTTIGPGSLHYDSLTVSGQCKLTVKGPITLVVDSLETFPGSELTLDATEGPIELFCTGPVTLNSNSDVYSATDSARDILVYFTTTSDTDIHFASNASFVGAIFAPYAAVTVSSNWHIYGALGAKAISMESNSQLHFDVSLLRAPGEKPIGVERIWWGNGPLPEGLATGARTDPFRQLGITDPDELPDLGTAIDEAVTAAGF